MIEVAADKFDTHEYLASVKHGGSVKFEQRYEKYRGRYTFPPETYAETAACFGPRQRGRRRITKGLGAWPGPCFCKRGELI